MEIMNLVCGDRRSLEDGQSCVSKDPFLSLPCRPVFPSHEAVVGGRSAPSQPVAFIISTHPVEPAATRQRSFEVIDAGKFDVRHCGLVMVTILIEPRNGVRTRAAVRRFVVLRDGRGAALSHGLRVQQRPRQLHAKYGTNTESQPTPPIQLEPENAITPHTASNLLLHEPSSYSTPAMYTPLDSARRCSRISTPSSYGQPRTNTHPDRRHLRRSIRGSIPLASAVRCYLSHQQQLPLCRTRRLCRYYQP